MAIDTTQTSELYAIAEQLADVFRDQFWSTPRAIALGSSKRNP